MADDTTTILTAKKPWLSDEEKSRVAELARYRCLYDGRHMDLFFKGRLTKHSYKAIGPDPRNVLYLTENWPGRCVLKYADLLYGEALTVAPQDTKNEGLKAALARVMAGGTIHQSLYQSAVESSWSGTAWIQPLIRGGAVTYETVAPENVFPRYEHGTRILLGATIKYRLAVNGQPCVRVIDHRVVGGKGYIVQELWRLDDKDASTVAAQLDLSALGPDIQPAQETGLSEPAIVEIPNYSTGGVGASDFFPFDDVGDLADEINNRRSQIARVLDTHGDPSMEVASKLLDASGNVIVNGRAITNPDMNVPAVRYITWESQLEHQLAALTSDTNAFLGHMEVAPVLVGLGGGNTSADSWKKFRLAASQTLARVNRKQIYAEPQVRELVRIALALDVKFAAAPTFTPGEITTTWSDGLPADEEAIKDATTGYHDGGLMSTRVALRMVHKNWSESEIEEEIGRLGEEAEASLPTSFRDGGLDLQDKPATEQPPEPAATGAAAVEDAAVEEPGSGQDIKVSETFIPNGAQLAQAVAIVQGVNDGSIPKDSGQGLLEIMFNLKPAQAVKILGSAGNDVKKKEEGGGETGDAPPNGDKNGEAADPPIPPEFAAQARKVAEGAQS